MIEVAEVNAEISAQKSSDVEAVVTKEYKSTKSGIENKDYSYLLEKIDMTEKDKENMEKSIKFLVDKKMDTNENIKKLEAIVYGVDYIEIGGVKFSREKLVPDVKFTDKPNKNGLFDSKQKGIYKTIYNGNLEYYLTADQYAAQAKKQGKIAIETDHLRRALKSLPGDFSFLASFVGGKILGIILNLSMSGAIGLDGKLSDKDETGYLGSVSLSGDDSRVFGFHKDGGYLAFHSKEVAYPCLSLIK